MDAKEGKSMEEVQENISLTDTDVHAQLEEGQEQNPNLVGSVELELETQDSIRRNGVELASETPEDANIAAKPSNEPHANAETDKLVSNVDSDMHRGSKVSMEIESEENGDEKGRVLKDDMGSKANPSVELYAGAETDNLVGKVDGESHHTEVPMEIEKEDEEGKALKDGVISKANPSNEPRINAETDNDVCKVEPDVPRDSEVAMEKLIDGLSSKVNPSNEPHTSDDTDNAACKAELDTSRDSAVAMEKLIDGVSNKANPSNEPHISAETDHIVCKTELDMSLDSKVAMEKLMDGVSNEANPPKEPHISAKTDNVVCTVELNRPRDNEVEMQTEPESDGEKGESLKVKGALSSKTKLSLHIDIKEEMSRPKFYVGREVGMKSSDPEQSFLWAPGAAEGNDSGTEEEQAAFMREVENLYKERNLEFKAPKFYREELNLLKLWRAVIKLGGYEKVTSCKLWRQVGESFNPPKTCTTVSWTFRNFYEKALLEFEKHRLRGGELALPSEPTRVENRADGSHTLGSGRALRDSAARAMQGWHSQRLLGNGEVGDAIIKDKHLSSMPKSDKQLKSSGLLKRKKPYPVDCAVQVADMKAIKPRLDIMIFDIGPPADWVKINVKKFNDCFEVYALVPGLLREEVHVQSDPAGRLVIFGQPTQLDNPWGVTPFKKVVSLPLRIDPHQTSAVVTLNGQLFVRVPFEQSDF